MALAVVHHSVLALSFAVLALGDADKLLALRQWESGARGP